MRAALQFLDSVTCNFEYIVLHYMRFFADDCMFFFFGGGWAGCDDRTMRQKKVQKCATNITTKMLFITAGVRSVYG